MALNSAHKRDALLVCNARRRLKEMDAAPTTLFAAACRLKNLLRDADRRDRLQETVSLYEKLHPAIATEAVRMECEQIVQEIPQAAQA